MAGLWSAALLSTKQISNEMNEPDARSSKIQVALLLDTSGSMDGLIEQAKSQLWKMVNELSSSTKGGKSPDIELALYEYGKTPVGATKGYMQQIVPLSKDLDLVSEKLFELRTDGGEEYCGLTIGDAVEHLAWSNNPEDLKLIIIAGNESFSQGMVDYKKKCESAVVSDIVINTIYCGNCDEGVRLYWKDGAERGKGRYMCISQDEKVVHIETPYDDRLLKLNSSLNETYIRYGKEGEKYRSRQIKQDQNAASYGAANVAERVISKGNKKMYNNSRWDVIDALEDEPSMDIEQLEEAYLPEEMKAMSTKEKLAYVERKKQERESIQKEISAITKKRFAFIQAKQKEELEHSDKNRLDNIMIKTVREQALDRKFEFK